MEAKNAPLIRFHGYFEDWQTKKLKHLCNTFIDGDWIESKDQSKSGIRLIQTGNIGIAKFLDKPNNAKWISNETFESLHCNEIFHNDILISRLPEPAGRACLLPNLPYRCITAVDCSIVRCNEKNDSSFIVQFLSSPKYFKEVTLLLAGGTRQRISRKNLEEITIKTPLLSEQTRIASLFTALDKQISTSEAKLDKLRTIKKTLLKKMFAAFGENIPQIRFKGFEGEWEEKKLGEFCSVERGIRVTRKDLNDQGEFPVYQNTDYPMGYFSKYNVDANNPFVIIGGSAGLIGFSKTKFWAADDCAYFRDSRVIEKNFLFYLLLKNILYIKKNIRGSSVPRLDRKVLIDMKVTIPTKEITEQIQIANLLSTLDKQICNQEQKIEKLKAIKKTLLKKMFV